ncbi:hypothetical protein ACHAXT_006678 [Thalassiosira profunda]
MASASASESSLSTERVGAAVSEEEPTNEVDGTCDVSSLGVGEDAATNSDNNDADDEASRYTVGKLKELYHHVATTETRCHLHHNFNLPTDGEIKDSEFEAAPMVLLIGQYSTGKTTFLNHLLGEDFPGMHIGPEPTTDKFMALYHDGECGAKSDSKMVKAGLRHDDDASARRSVVTDDIRASGRLVKGNTLTVTPNLPFSSLSQFGSAFLNHFVGSACHSPLLKKISFVDTPGVLSGEKQRVNRAYDFGSVAKWFADRSDLILLLFDAHKLDISDEFKSVIDTISQHNSDKIRCVLNKADCVTREQLVRVYGSLMWSMGKIFHSPEVVRVYTGSYWNAPLQNDDFTKMFSQDERLLVKELVDLPRCAAERKVNQMVSRIRLVKVHVCILGTLRRMTPLWLGKKQSRQRILNELESILDNVRVEFDLSKGDMPDCDEFRKCLRNFPDFAVFPPIDKALICRLDQMIDKDIPEIVRDAEIVANDARLGKSRSSEEPKDSNEAVPVEIEQDEEEKEVSTESAAKISSSAPMILGLLGKVILFCILLLSAAEGGFYCKYSSVVHSWPELRDGYQKLILAALDDPRLSRVRRKRSVSASSAQAPTPEGASPLSSLPTLSGVASTNSGPAPTESSESKDEL